MVATWRKHPPRDDGVAVAVVGVVVAGNGAAAIRPTSARA
jgi:hypothetical protein